MERITAQAMGTAVAAEALTWAGTFHAIGARILREHALSIGLSPEFSIHDREDSADLMNLCRHGAGLSKTEARFPTKGTCLAIYSRAVNAEEPLAHVLRDHFPWCARWEEALKLLFKAYVSAKQAQNVLDYDDLLLAWAQVMSDADFAAHIGAAWDHVLIDEYQDTNRLQARILKALKPDGRGLTVVGDDAQSIYAFRAATVRNIFDFPESYMPRAEVVTLDRNYRSTQPILAAANAVIAEASERFTHWYDVQYRWSVVTWLRHHSGHTEGEISDLLSYLEGRLAEKVWVAVTSAGKEEDKTDKNRRHHTQMEKKSREKGQNGSMK